MIWFAEAVIEVEAIQVGNELPKYDCGKPDLQVVFAFCLNELGQSRTISAHDFLVDLYDLALAGDDLEVSRALSLPEPGFRQRFPHWLRRTANGISCRFQSIQSKWARKKQGDMQRLTLGG